MMAILRHCFRAYRTVRCFGNEDAESRLPNVVWPYGCVDDTTVGSLIPSAAWSSGMIVVSGARGLGFNSQSSPFVIIAGTCASAEKLSNLRSDPP